MYVLEYDRGSWIWKALLRKPKWAILFIEYVGHQLAKDIGWQLDRTHAEH